MSHSANGRSNPPNPRSLATSSSGGKRMKTVLDLIGEFAVLHDAKVMWGGKLPNEAEQRWEELRDFYDLLMSKSGVGPRPVTRQFTAKDIEEKVTSRERLRVPLEMDMIFRAGEEFHAAKGVNVSRGGLYLSSPLVLPVNSTVTVYLASSDITHESLLEAPGEVVWATEEGRDEASVPPGMGISFTTQEGLLERHLDAMVINSLVRHLSGVDANSLAPEFLLKERVEL